MNFPNRLLHCRLLNRIQRYPGSRCLRVWNGMLSCVWPHLAGSGCADRLTSVSMVSARRTDCRTVADGAASTAPARGTRRPQQPWVSVPGVALGLVSPTSSTGPTRPRSRSAANTVRYPAIVWHSELFAELRSGLSCWSNDVSHDYVLPVVSKKKRPFRLKINPRVTVGNTHFLHNAFFQKWHLIS